MKLPRFFHKLYAFLNGYYWLPCPICGKYFGGHEKNGGVLLTSCGEGISACINCKKKAHVMNAGYNYKEMCRVVNIASLSLKEFTDACLAFGKILKKIKQ